MDPNEVFRVQDTVLILLRKTSAGDRMFVSQETDAYLSSSVDDLSGVVLPIVLDNPAEGVLNCGVVAFHEMMLNKANGER